MHDRSESSRSRKPYTGADDGSVIEDVYIRVSPLPRECQPAWCVRHHGGMLLTVDPFADRYDLLRLMSEALTDFEVDTIWEAFGWTDGCVPTGWLAEAGPIGVPESLWLRAVEFDEP